LQSDQPSLLIAYIDSLLKRRSKIFKERLLPQKYKHSKPRILWTVQARRKKKEHEINFLFRKFIESFVKRNINWRYLYEKFNSKNKITNFCME
jgi:hypothetical protein